MMHIEESSVKLMRARKDDLNMLEKHHPLYDRLVEIVGSKYVADDDFAVYAYSRDSSVFRGKIPAIVVRPGTTEEIVEIVKLANLTRTPVVPSGGRASIWGVPRGNAGSIIVDMTRMNKVVDFDEGNWKVTVQCGMKICYLQKYLKDRGYYFHDVYGPFYVNTLGGQLSGVHAGGGGLRWFQSGPSGRHVHALKVVLPTGHIVDLGFGGGTNVHQNKRIYRDVGGLGVLGMFIGDGGIFGIKVEATVAIFPLEPITQIRAFSFDSWDDLWQATSRLSQTQPIAATLMVGFDPRASETSTGEKTWALCFFKKGKEEEVDLCIKTAEKICKDARGKPGSEALNKVAEDAASGEILRDFAPHISFGMWNFLDALVPLTQGYEFYKKTSSWVDRKFMEKGLDKYGSRQDLILPFQIDSCYFSFLIYHDDAVLEARRAAQELGEEYAEYVTMQGATIPMAQGRASWHTASHWAPTYYQFIRSLKRTLDPNNIMNPGQWRL